MYLFSNAHIGMSGYYELADSIMGIESGLSEVKLQAAKEALQNAKMAYFKDGWVFVVNARKYLRYVNTTANSTIADNEVDNCPNWFKEYVRAYEGGMTPPHQTPKDQQPKTKGGVGEKVPDLVAVQEEYPAIDVAFEWAKCRDYFRARGKVMKDWRATFRNWMRSDIPKKARPKPKPAPLEPLPPPKPENIARIEAMKEEIRQKLPKTVL